MKKKSKEFYALLIRKKAQLPNYASKLQSDFNCVRRRKNALLIWVGVEIVWDNLDSMDGWTWDAHLAYPADFFAGADDITKERETGIEIIERTP